MASTLTKHPNGIYEFFISGEKELERFIKNNHAEYTGCYIEGSLIDNFVMSTSKGYAAFYESHRNEWTSWWRVEYQTGFAQDMWRHWYEFEGQMERCGGDSEPPFLK